MNPVEFLQARLEEERLEILNSQNGPVSRALAWVQRKTLLDTYVQYPDDFPHALRDLLTLYIAHPSFDQTWLSS